LRLGALVGVGAFCYVARRVFIPAMESRRHPRWAWLGVAIVAEIVSMGAFMRMQRRTLMQGGVTLPLRSALAITYASNAVSVTVPMAGGSASTAFTGRQFASRGAEPALVGWALAMSGIAETVGFAVCVGALGAVGGHGATAVASVVVAVAGVAPVVILVLVLHRDHPRRRLARQMIRALSWTQRLIGRPRGEVSTLVNDGLARFIGFRLHRRAGAAILGFAVLNWAADGVCLAAAIRFVGQPVPWASLALIYSAGVGAATVGITPAGLGVVETAMAGSMVAVGMRSNDALAAALVYRAISCWLVLVVGWTVFVAMGRVDPTGRAGADRDDTAAT